MEKKNTAEITESIRKRNNSNCIFPISACSWRVKRSYVFIDASSYPDESYNQYTKFQRVIFGFEKKFFFFHF